MHFAMPTGQVAKLFDSVGRDERIARHLLGCMSLDDEIVCMQIGRKCVAGPHAHSIALACTRCQVDDDDDCTRRRRCHRRRRLH
jgi:hypothetical protein